MTLTGEQAGGRGVVTNSIGKRTTAHLNLTRTLADPPPVSEALLRARERAALRVAFDEAGNKRRQGRPRIAYAGAEGDDAA